MLFPRAGCELWPPVGRSCCSERDTEANLPLVQVHLKLSAGKRPPHAKYLGVAGITLFPFCRQGQPGPSAANAWFLHRLLEQRLVLGRGTNRSPEQLRRLKSVKPLLYCARTRSGLPSPSLQPRRCLFPSLQHLQHASPKQPAQLMHLKHGCSGQ